MKAFRAYVEHVEKPQPQNQATSFETKITML